MGLFSSKKKYVVNVTTQPIFEDKQVPTSALNGIVKGIMQGQDIVPAMLEELTSCLGIRAITGLINTRKNGYNMGIPSAQVTSYIKAKDQVIAAIQANIGRVIEARVLLHGGRSTRCTSGGIYCFDSLGYSPDTNELTGLSATVGFPCYLSDMIATYLRADFDWMLETNDTGMLTQMGPSPRSGFRPSAPFNTLSTIGQYAEQPAYEVSDVATDDYVTIRYEFKDAQGNFITRGLTVSMAAFENTQDFHMCRYKVPSTGKTGFFTYQHGTGRYPAIDIAYLLQNSALGTYFPWAYFRIDGKDVYDSENKQTVDQIRAWCDTLGVSFDKLHEGVHEDPDVSDVEQAMLMMAVTPGRNNDACREYLFKHFTALHANALSQSVLDPTLDGRMDNFTSSPSQIQHIQDKRFAMSLQFSGITKRQLVGVVGRKGEYKSKYAVMSQEAQHFLTQTPGGAGTGNALAEQPGWVYQYQVQDNVYEEIVVYGLRTNYEVHRKKGFAAGGQDKDLLVPIDSAIVQTMSVPAREQLLCRALTMMVNTVVVIKTPWYASSAFRVIMIIIAVVVTLFSGGTAWQAIVSAVGLGATALAITVMTIIVQYVVVAAGVKLFVKTLGPKFALIAALVAVIYGNTQAAASQLSATWAQNLVDIATSIVKEAIKVSQEQIAAGIKSIAEDAQAFSVWAQEQYDGLGDKMQALGLNPAIVGIDAFDVVKMGPRLVLGESPGDYYTRTIHAGNIGVVGIEMTETYVESQLQLPTFNQTQESFNYGG